MKHFKPAKLIGVVGLLVVATAAGTAVAAPPQAAAPAPAGSQQAPSTCQSMMGPSSSTSGTTDATASGDAFGLEGFIADALSKVCLSDDQRSAIEQLGKEAKPEKEAVGNARHALVTTLAEQLRADNFDESTLKPRIDDLVNAREHASPVLRKALEELHGILDSGQRTTFVDALEARMREMKGAAKNWLDSLSKDLGLSDDQKSRIKDVLTKEQSDVEGEIDRTKAVFDAFKGDQFSIEKITPESDVGPHARARAEEMVSAAREIAGILTSDQRSKLADKIESKGEGNAPGEAPSGGTPSTGTRGQPAPSGGNLGTTSQDLWVGGGGYRVGAVGGWGGGFARGYGFRGGYVGGYPFYGGWGPGIW